MRERERNESKVRVCQRNRVCVSVCVSMWVCGCACVDVRVWMCVWSKFLSFFNSKIRGICWLLRNNVFVLMSAFEGKYLRLVNSSFRHAKVRTAMATWIEINHLGYASFNTHFVVINLVTIVWFPFISHDVIVLGKVWKIQF